MRHTVKQWAFRIAVALSVGLGAVKLVNAQSLIWLGTGGSYESVAQGVSDDGSVVVGYHFSGASTAFVWTPQSGMVSLPSLGGHSCRAFGVSPNGTIVVGWAMDANYNLFPVKWVDGVPAVIISREGIASDATSSGFVAGYYYESGTSLAFLQQPDGALLNLGHLGGNFAQAYAITEVNGTPVVVGRSFTIDNDHAFLWTPSSGIINLGTLGNWSWALGISDDGQVVVGASWPTRDWSTRYAVRWTKQGTSWVIESLGPVPNGTWAEAYDCNRDGTIVVGRGGDARQYTAFRWTPSNGMEDLNVTYASLLEDGSRLESATAISADGCYIVGQGRNAATGRREAFLLSVCCTSHNGDVDSNNCVDDADLLAVLFAFGNSGQNLGRVDVNCDGTVDDADLLIVLFNFGSGC